MPKRHGRRVQTERERQIIQSVLAYVRSHPTATVPKIAKAIKPRPLSRAAAQNWIRKLRMARRLKHGMTVDLDALGWKYKYRIDIRIRPAELRDQKANQRVLDAGKKWGRTNPQEMLAFYILDQLAEECKKTVIVEDVCILLGDPADLTATVRVQDPEDIFPFITEEIRDIPGIESTSTCTIAWSCAHERDRIEAARGRAEKKRKAKKKASAPSALVLVTQTEARPVQAVEQLPLAPGKD